MKWLSLTLALLLLAIPSLALAQDPSTEAENDPNTNPAANACFVGGSMAGKCTTTDLDGDGQVEEWEIFYMYTAGWYIIRLDWGIYTRDQVPQLYRWLLPAVPVVIDPVTGQVIELPVPEPPCTITFAIVYFGSTGVSVPMEVIRGEVGSYSKPGDTFGFYWNGINLYLTPLGWGGSIILYSGGSSSWYAGLVASTDCPTPIPPN